MSSSRNQLKAEHIMQGVVDLISHLTTDTAQLAADILDLVWEQSRVHISKGCKWKNSIAYRSPRGHILSSEFPNARILWDGSRASDWLECLLADSNEGPYWHVMCDEYQEELCVIELADRDALMEYYQQVCDVHCDRHYLANILRQTLCVPIDS